LEPPALIEEPVSDENSVKDGSYNGNKKKDDDYEDDWEAESLKESVKEDHNRMPSLAKYKPQNSIENAKSK
jgi:hypothetical protein